MREPYSSEPDRREPDPSEPDPREHGRAHWDSFHRRWPTLQPPLRPHPDVCDAVRALIAGHTQHAVLLGVTPELSALAARTVAVDWCESTLRHVWPGDTDERRALRADWNQLPCAAGAFSAAVGDGSLNCLEYPSGYIRVLSELARVVQPGGTVAIRVYLTPEAGESAATVCAQAMAGAMPSVHAFKWRLAMALCAERKTANIAVQAIWRAFAPYWRNRDALRRATGWSDDDLRSLEVYEHLPEVFSFPTANQVLSVVSDRFAAARFVATGTYELAERCPVLAMDARP